MTNLRKEIVKKLEELIALTNESVDTLHNTIIDFEEQFEMDDITWDELQEQTDPMQKDYEILYTVADILEHLNKQLKDEELYKIMVYLVGKENKPMHVSFDHEERSRWISYNNLYFNDDDYDNIGDIGTVDYLEDH